MAVVLGTRPEIIKLAGIVRALGDRGYVAHTQQHYDPGLSNVFLDGFDLPRPEITVTGVGGSGRASQFARILDQLTAAFEHQPPAAVIVQGDTNTAAAAAQAAHFLAIPVVHVEAGLRSFDRAMPEEINRMLIGVMADLHCAPTDQARVHLLAEGVDPARIVVTGNTVIEATLEMLPDAAERAKVLSRVGVADEGFVLATIHRPENTDSPEHLATILGALQGIGLPVVMPLHPRTLARVNSFGLRDLLGGINVIEPTDSATFLALAAHARLLVSDSGGVQEECTVVKRPLIVIRNSTERPEAIDAGFARRLLPDGSLATGLREAASDPEWIRSLADLESPYGDGTASAQVVAALDALLRQRA
ncbi:UDP-N-acetylglucosamine 2-epimerase (non-hydrolyzing) [Nocardioides caeni]|uniref:UDP-N-acetylglucosamine 2-epimerase (Non-hydrolyzing) n=1 Tax=Nocardioides caeni TaxID=574700 RepID=A0A4S8N3H5_9ACTN|nr:UDP-N-acetylglucosamine 2-epimerase (non-hydrolyzing) [Nocardioides caeni]